jgi:acyl carrier protein
MRSDGCLEHLGRRDDIVRIRGQSVDPSLVEAALASIPGVADAAATSRQRSSGESELVAFIAASAATRPTPAEIGASLRERLPDAMVPTAIVVLDTLPLTPFAKIDRAAISALAADLAPGVPGNPMQPPASTLEREIAEIWGAVLAQPSISANVAFLEIGGDSFQAMEILVRFRDRLGVEMGVADFFALPTVASQARFLDARVTVGGAAAARR